MKADETTNFTPVFDANGLMPCITRSAKTGKILMVAYMNREALDKTLKTREAHYWSRSRQALWHKGATSGHIQKVVRLKVDCDQDCLLMDVAVTEEIACHTGRETCFYREVDLEDPLALRFIEA